jgi:transcription elongation factor GreA
MSNEETQTWLTQEAADRLAAELADLEGPRRADIVKKIEAARAEGDLKENGGYHAAREEQGKIEGRIRQLKHMLEHAHIGTPPEGESGVVGQGMLITVDFGGEEMKFLLGSREISTDDDLDVYSIKSPLGSAVMGAKVGDTVNYTAPNGKQIAVAILEAQTYF